MVTYPDIFLTLKLGLTDTSHEINRNNLRSLVLAEFIKERAGTGKGEDTSKYRYMVEQLTSGNWLFLTRPAVLNKGFDFVIHVENHIFHQGKDNPTHDDLLEDLRCKKNNNPKQFDLVYQAIQRIYYCEDPTDILPQFRFEALKTGLRTELILKICKWFFIEQDIRYWNWSGRNMLMTGINVLASE
jgi:hypothetical protein